MLRLASIPRFATLAAVVFALSGCSPGGGGFATAPTTAVAPSPDSPENAVRLFAWCWENLDIDHYREVFTDDYNFAFSQADTAGEFYRINPWTREDELLSAANIFRDALSITVAFNGPLTSQPDPRPGKEEPWHQQIEIPKLTLTINWKDGSRSKVTGGALFFAVRGDSAAIPPELIQHGFGPDPGRWYIERWEDQTGGRNPGLMRVRAARLRS